MNLYGYYSRLGDGQAGVNQATRDQELAPISAQMQAIVAEAQSTDPWTSRARPAFLYVMCALLMWSIPMGLIAAAEPKMAQGIAGA